MIEWTGDAAGENRETRGRVEDALVGLLGWLGGLDGRTRLLGPDAEHAVIALDRAAANSFQIGVFQDTGPFLAFPGALWWFGDVWRAGAAGPAGVALVADYPVDWVLLLPSDWPCALAEFARQCGGRGGLALYPFARRYGAARAGAGGRFEPVAEAADLDPTRRVVLDFQTEIFSWLTPLLRSPLPV